MREGAGPERLVVKLSMEKARQGNPSFARRMLGLEETQSRESAMGKATLANGKLGGFSYAVVGYCSQICTYVSSWNTLPIASAQIYTCACLCRHLMPRFSLGRSLSKSMGLSSLGLQLLWRMQAMVMGQMMVEAALSLGPGRNVARYVDLLLCTSV